MTVPERSAHDSPPLTLIVGKSLIGNISADVRFQASIMEGTVTGRDAVTRILRAAGSLYENRVMQWILEDGVRGAQEYTASVGGQPITGLVSWHLDSAGQIDELVVNHRPLAAMLNFSSAIARKLAGEPEAARFLSG